MVSVFERLFGGSGRQSSDDYTVASPMSEYSFSIVGGQTRTGESISPTSALKNSTVFSCVSIVSSTVAQLPLNVYRKVDGGKEPVENPVSKLLRRPNDIQTGYEFKSALVTDMLTYGEAFILKVITASGKVTELVPMDPDKMEVTRSATGRRTFTYNKSTVYTEKQIIHFQDFSNTACQGLSKVNQCANLVAIDNAIDYQMADVFSNGNSVSGVLSYPTAVPPETAKGITEGYKSKFGQKGSARGGVMVVGDGAQFKQLDTLSPADADMLKLKEQTIARIAAVFKVPSHLLELSTATKYNNLSQRQSAFYRDGIAPLLVNIQQKLELALLGGDESLCIEFDVQDFIKGDLVSAVNVGVSGVRNGVLTQNEARELAGYNASEQEGTNSLLRVNYTDNPANEADREADKAELE